jgi:hypothetical protein
MTDFSYLSLVTTGKCQDSTLEQYWTPSFHIASKSSYINHFTIQGYID